MKLTGRWFPQIVDMDSGNLLGLKRVRNFETGYPICENRTVTG